MTLNGTGTGGGFLIDHEGSMLLLFTPTVVGRGDSGYRVPCAGGEVLRSRELEPKWICRLIEFCSFLVNVCHRLMSNAFVATNPVAVRFKFFFSALHFAELLLLLLAWHEPPSTLLRRRLDQSGGSHVKEYRHGGSWYLWIRAWLWEPSQKDDRAH